jgi:hypothetical protein
MSTRNLRLLTNAAKLLKPLLGELVFVGGCTTALLITDQAAAELPVCETDLFKVGVKIQYFWMNEERLVLVSAIVKVKL